MAARRSIRHRPALHGAGSLRFAALLFASALTLVGRAASAHPHDPNDPFAYFPSDTVSAGDSTLVPLRPDHVRWKMWQPGAEEPRLEGTIEQWIAREDTPAGRRWRVTIERRDAEGPLASRDTIWLTGGALAPIYHAREGAGVSLRLSYEGRHLSGWMDRGGARLAVDETLRRAAFPHALRGLLFTRLPLAEGYATEIATFDPGIWVRGGERRNAVRVLGLEWLRIGHRTRRCWKLALIDRDPAGITETVWVDRKSRRLLREERRDARGQLLGWIEAE